MLALAQRHRCLASAMRLRLQFSFGFGFGYDVGFGGFVAFTPFYRDSHKTCLP